MNLYGVIFVAILGVAAAQRGRWARQCRSQAECCKSQDKVFGGLLYCASYGALRGEECPASDSTVFILAEGCAFEYSSVNTISTESPIIYRLSDLFPGWPHDDLTAVMQTGPAGSIFLIKGGDAFEYPAPGAFPVRVDQKWYNLFSCDPRYFTPHDPNPHGILSLPEGYYYMTNEPADKRCVNTGAHAYSPLVYHDLRQCLGGDNVVGAILEATYRYPIESYIMFFKDLSVFRECALVNGRITSISQKTLRRNR